MRTDDKPDASKKSILDALQGINNYLAIINGRIEILLLSDFPDYVRPDLVNIHQAEQEASQILRSLNLFCHKNL